MLKSEGSVSVAVLLGVELAASFLLPSIGTAPLQEANPNDNVTKLNNVN